jgi:hypothetical protein
MLYITPLFPFHPLELMWCGTHSIWCMGIGFWLKGPRHIDFGGIQGDNGVMNRSALKKTSA